VIASTPPRRGPGFRGLALLALALGLSALAASLRARRLDDLPGAWWIGHSPTARAGGPAALVFGSRVSLAAGAPRAVLRLRADRRYEAFFDGVRVGAGGGAGAPDLDAWTLTGPIAAGEHEILVVVSHPEGVASLRLALAFDGPGKREVVTGPGWRVDDDVSGMKKGFGGLRYPATLWARPPLSVFSVSSSRRSDRGSADVSSAPASSRIPSRAATE
jgi:hypothetical protein